MSEQLSELKAAITFLTDLLQEIRSNDVDSVVVQIARDESRTYHIDGLHDALVALLTEVRCVDSPDERVVEALQSQYEHDKDDVVRIVGRLAQIAVTGSTGSKTFRAST
jgi:hypothetical protein